MTLVLPYRGILTPTTRCAVRITDGGLASLRPGHDAAAALLAIERREPREAPDPPPWHEDGGPEHLALVPVTRPADIPAALGWFGPFDDVADLCAELRWREDRLGEYLVRLGRTSMGFAQA
ncbi:MULTISPECIES: hypothetical protein [unclassified Pseudonocardia]|uniref:hypothetical protein n=1 Tax=unclassified Pseudonocardia TaxID=2619320 RepID=UPI0009608AE3|nr:MULTISPECIES: hypothetical protein [unclassified Pseudonocardia]MBN9096617.1 hypothetical protein [Pseudonocardia sp.]OJY43781.1 MAG: hypothetical protein BGP03_07700 [Pseudonocardia sp. 73-21]